MLRRIGGAIGALSESLLVGAGTRHGARAIFTTAPVGADVHAGTRATRLALACFESIRSGRPVSLGPIGA